MITGGTFTLDLSDTRDRMLVDLSLHEAFIKRALERERHHPSSDADRMDDTVQDCETKLGQIQVIRGLLLDLFYNSYSS